MALSSDWKKASQIQEDLEETLESLEKLLERTKVMYEQYFMGIQRAAPMQLHRDVERRIRELTQHQIRNTGLRFRLTTLTQKFGSYNTYWKRTIREIEQGRYVRDLARVKRKADMNGEELPDELLAKLPKLAQDRIRRERARVAERAQREAEESGRLPKVEAAAAGAAPGGGEAEKVRAPRKAVHEISEEEAGSLFGDGDLDMDGIFGALVADEPGGGAGKQAAAAAKPGPAAAKPEAAAAKPEMVAKPAPATGPGDPLIPRAVLKARRDSQPPPVGVKTPVPGPGGVPRPPGAPPIPTVGAARPGASGSGRGTGAGTGAGAGAPAAGMSEKQARELHARYNKARQMVGDRSDVSYDKLMSSLGKQAPAIMKQHGARGVEWQVVVRGDKVVLKAKPVK